MDKKSLSFIEKFSYGIGAVGKDMVYMLTSTYVLYYYQDLLGVDPLAMGMILLIARVFDALNDPFMGVVVAKTKTKWGKFRPWLFSGTVLNALILYALFAVPAKLQGNGLTIYAGIVYIIWGVTYTMMDIPYWSMIPAFTESGPERESLSALARTCAGVGSALISVVTMMSVHALGKGNEVAGFKWFALIVAVLFVVFILMTCINIKETSTVDMETASVRQMFSSLFKNDQALVMVVTIVLVNMSVYLTSNLVIYFFKYDFGGPSWYSSYTIFYTFGGAMQVLSMMILFPLFRHFMDTLKIFRTALLMAVAGYITLLALSFTAMNSVFILFIPAFLIFAANGLLLVLTTIFLANTVDYGEYKNGTRDESVIFSLQTFVVKLASGIAAMATTICLAVFHFGDASEGAAVTMAQSSIIGLRMTMTVVPMIGLLIAIVYFNNRYHLDAAMLERINNALNRKQEANSDDNV